VDHHLPQFADLGVYTECHSVLLPEILDSCKPVCSGAAQLDAVFIDKVLLFGRGSIRQAVLCVNERVAADYHLKEYMYVKIAFF
jgi:hypothetical protein